MHGYRPRTYGDAFADVYDDWYQGISDIGATVDRLASLAGGGAVLELGVGTGRLALPLAERGVEVWGLDASGAMLERLRAKPGGDAVRLVRGDMAAPPLRPGPRFAVVFCAYNTFFNLSSPPAQQQGLQRAVALLGSGGCVAVEAFVPDDDAAREGVSVRTLELDRVVLGAAVRDRAAQTMTGQYVELSERGVRLRPWHIRYLFPAQLDDLAAGVGLQLAERWEGWAGEPFSDTSATHVSVYRRP